MQLYRTNNLRLIYIKHDFVYKISLFWRHKRVKLERKRRHFDL